MEIPNNPTPHIHYRPVEPVGTTAKPTLTDYTYGAEEDSRRRSFLRIPPI